MFTILNNGVPLTKSDGSVLAFDERYQAETFARAYGTPHTHRVVSALSGR